MACLRVRRAKLSSKEPFKVINFNALSFRVKHQTFIKSKCIFRISEYELLSLDPGFVIVVVAATVCVEYRYFKVL